MIDIMAIRQSYERRDLSEIRWKNRMDNPAEAMIKSDHSKSLKQFINLNKLAIRIEGWVQRNATMTTKIIRLQIINCEFTKIN